MVDIFTAEKRSEIMRQIGSRNTMLELKIRRALHLLGYRFRLHVKDLPGTPDIVFPRHRVAVQARGCFWHGHPCKAGRPPSSRKNFWGPKLTENKRRDRRNDRVLRAMGWTVIVVWECRCKTESQVVHQVERVCRALRVKTAERKVLGNAK